MLLIGSQATKVRFPEFRDPQDVDLVADYPEFEALIQNRSIRKARPIEGGKKYVFEFNKVMHEVEIAWPGTTADKLLHQIGHDKIVQGVMRGKYSKSTDYARVASPDLLLALKLSHRYKKDSPHFLKTMGDIEFLRMKGAVLQDAHRGIMELREAEAYNYSRPKLNVSKAEFFGGDVDYVYDHDSIHQAICHLGVPAYEMFKADKAEVMTSRALFERLPLHIRLLAVLEESYVLALERSQIPHGNKVSPKWSFDKALEKVCTSITSGWFREFAWEHYGVVQLMYKPNYVSRFHDGLAAGIVTPYRGAK